MKQDPQSTVVKDRQIIVAGRRLRIATVRDEELVEGEVAPEAKTFVPALKKSSVGADIFSFSQNVDEPQPKYDFTFEWDNAAVATTRNYNEWWEKLPQETRKNVRRAQKRGVEVRVARYNDEFVRGIKAIYDETPLRQGDRFPHYGKDLETVRQENGTYEERCEYLGAYFEGQLIGFMRFVYVDHVARIMQILASVAHTDKRPMNAMIAKAIDVCQERGKTCLVYSKFRFGNKKNSALSEFKKRSGFEEVLFPRYYIPLTWKGRLALRLKLHRGLLGILPSAVIDWALRLRGRLLRLRAGSETPTISMAATRN